MAIAKISTILVLADDVLMQRALASLLMMEGTIEVAVSEAQDAQSLAEHVSERKPDAIFISSSIASAMKDSLSELLIQQPGMRVVVGNDENNQLHIFKHEDRLLTRLDDLWHVINCD